MHLTDRQRECIVEAYKRDFPIVSHISCESKRTIQVGRLNIHWSTLSSIERRGLVYVSHRSGRNVDYELTALGRGEAKANS